MSYLDILPDKVFKLVYDESIKNIKNIEFFPKKTKYIIEPTDNNILRYCYVKKNNRIMLYYEYYSYGPAHTELQYIYIDFTIRKKSYVINNSIMFEYIYMKGRHYSKDIYVMSDNMIRGCLYDCGYSLNKRILHADQEITIPVNVKVFFHKCMDDDTIQ